MGQEGLCDQEIRGLVHVDGVQRIHFQGHLPFRDQPVLTQEVITLGRVKRRVIDEKGLIWL
jgi:hypothetical protein